MRIDTERLRLRAFVEDDHAAIVAAMNDWAVAQWLGSPPYPYSDDNARQWIALVQNDHEGAAPGRFAVADRETDAVIGCVSVEDRADGSLRIGASPPTQMVETSVMPVWNRIRLVIGALEDGDG